MDEQAGCLMYMSRAERNNKSTLYGSYMIWIPHHFARQKYTVCTL